MREEAISVPKNTFVRGNEHLDRLLSDPDLAAEVAKANEAVISRTRTPKTSPEELVRAERALPIESLADLAAPDIFGSDEELEEFLTFTRAERQSDT
ncbi:hypothetical protein AB0M95_23650 [Sphaerisporangium sp. NPDC051017]|uniref:hypothetical protein n=1 Tax=Sphaerisporangium sp. NPDC051017 TaxID=3154636 RepID=UPI00341DDA81